MKTMKGERSYSQLIRNLIEKKGNKEEILKFVGKDFIDEDMIKELKKRWKKWSEKYV